MKTFAISPWGKHQRFCCYYCGLLTTFVAEVSENKDAGL
jgi:hypothetical protein